MLAAGCGNVELLVGIVKRYVLIESDCPGGILGFCSRADQLPGAVHALGVQLIRQCAARYLLEHTPELGFRHEEVFCERLIGVRQ